MEKPVILTMGGHSALEIFQGAKEHGMDTICLAVLGREKTYTKYFKNLCGNVILLKSFKELTDASTILKLDKTNSIFIPHRYVQVYCDMEKIENSFPIRIFGNKLLLKYEERGGLYSQY